jgi:hypothetical protein
MFEQDIYKNKHNQKDNIRNQEFNHVITIRTKRRHNKLTNTHVHCTM